jgi:hypothetical protein
LNKSSNFFEDLDSNDQSSEKSSFFSDLDEPSMLKKGVRAATQFGLGRLSIPLLPYELAASSETSASGRTISSRQDMFQEIERLGSKKRKGQITPEENEELKNLIFETESPLNTFSQFEDQPSGLQGILEKVSGEDLAPKGVFEKSINWLGMIKKPSNVKKLFNIGANPKEIMKSLLPTGSETARSIGAGGALQLAEEGDLGPIGTMASAIVGDLAGGGAAGAIKGILSPKKSIATAFSKLTSADKIQIQKDLIKDFRESGIQADLGSITDSNLVKMMQARISQSGLTGKALDDFRTNLTNEIKDQYKKIADGIGDVRFQSNREASEVVKDYVKSSRDMDKSRISKMYDEALSSVAPESKVGVKDLEKSISKIESSLAPGALKSTEQKSVLNALSDLKNDILNGEATVQSLLNNKIALNDIINYEVQGGQKQLLKSIVAELDKAIVSHGAENKDFGKLYKKANLEFSEHAKKFRNPNIDKILTSQDPEILFNKMNSIQGIRDLEKSLGTSWPGRKAFKDLKRLKFDQMIGQKMTDNVSEQIKLGTFSNLLKNPKNQQLIQELVGKENFPKLLKLQKSAGKLAQSAEKFLNTSKSGTTEIDIGLISKTMYDISHLISGNPWPLAKTAGMGASIKYLSKLLSDPAFLKMTEEAILASDKNNVSKLFTIFQRMESPIKAAVVEQNQ